LDARELRKFCVGSSTLARSGETAELVRRIEELRRRSEETLRRFPESESRQGKCPAHERRRNVSLPGRSVTLKTASDVRAVAMA
ncbi:MAG: HalX domain-containing protein, partial [Thermoanaerobaculia bacterium]